MVGCGLDPLVLGWWTLALWCDIAYVAATDSTAVSTVLVQPYRYRTGTVGSYSRTGTITTAIITTVIADVRPGALQNSLAEIRANGAHARGGAVERLAAVLVDLTRDDFLEPGASVERR